MNKEHGIVICPGVTVSDNYIRLTNKPKINGIELCGNKTSTQLNLLSNQIGEYSEIDLATAGNDSYMLVFPQAGQPSKLPYYRNRHGKGVLPFRRANLLQVKYPFFSPYKLAKVLSSLSPTSPLFSGWN